MKAENTPTTLAEKRKEWIACLSGPDRNSICNQLYQTLWNAAAFRVINEARSLASKHDGSEIEVNYLLHSLLDQCFRDSQSLSIRRFLDGYGLFGRKGVSSLASLLTDMQEHAHLLKRGDIFKVEGLEYDVEHIKQQNDEYCLKQIDPKRAVAFFVPPKYDYQTSVDRHQQIDQLSGVSSENRSAEDSVRKEVFDGLKNKMEQACEEIKIFVDKFLAHPATDVSRAYNNADAIAIPLGDLWKAHETLSKTTNFLCLYILNNDYHMSFLPSDSSDLFKYIDQPLVAPGSIGKLEACREAYEKETQEWGHWTVAELRDTQKDILPHPSCVAKGQIAAELKSMRSAKGIRGISRSCWLRLRNRE